MREPTATAGTLGGGIAALAAFFDKQLTRVSGHPVGRLPIAIQ